MSRSYQVIQTMQIDFELLAEQKRILVGMTGNAAQRETIEGILALIDSIQDTAVSDGAVPEDIVFPRTVEEQTESDAEFEEAEAFTAGYRERLIGE